MSAFFVGLILGLVMCIPIGPINIWVMRTQLKNGVLHALAVALGGAIMDFVYFYVILSGLSLFEFSIETQKIFKVLGIFIIFLMGIFEIFSAKNIDDVKTKRATPNNLLASITLGVVLYSSNPTLVVSITGLCAFVKSLDLFLFSPTHIFIFSTGISLGSFLWFFILTKIVARFEEAIRTNYLKTFSKVGGVLMVLLSSYLGISLLGN